MKIGNKNVKFIPDIHLEVQDRIFKFHDMFGKMPKAISVGPIEFVSLLTQLKPMMVSEVIIKLDQKIRLFGLPVYVKQSPGIDLIIPSSLVPRFAIGAVTNEE